MTPPPQIFAEWWAAHSGQRDPYSAEVAYRAIMAFVKEVNARVEASLLTNSNSGHVDHHPHGHAIVRMLATWHQAPQRLVNNTVDSVNNSPPNSYSLSYEPTGDRVALLFQQMPWCDVIVLPDGKTIERKAKDFPA